MSEKQSEVTHLYISKKDLERVYSRCDLGDSINIHAYQYPRSDYLEDLVKFERSEANGGVLDKLIEQRNEWIKIALINDMSIPSNSVFKLRLEHEIRECDLVLKKLRERGK